MKTYNMITHLARHIYIENNSLLPFLAKYKYSYWKWKIVDDFNLNVSFIIFDLKYSGEAYLLERIIINSTGNNAIGRYCGRRYYWSVFASSSPITLEFHTFQHSYSQFTLQYQISEIPFETFLQKYKNYNNFNILENITFVYPFSRNHMYILSDVSHFTWNIVVTKMYKLMPKIFKIPLVNTSIIIFDGPDLIYIKFLPGFNFIFAPTK